MSFYIGLQEFRGRDLNKVLMELKFRGCLKNNIVSTTLFCGFEAGYQ